jgi:hypothetical protein
MFAGLTNVGNATGSKQRANNTTTMLVYHFLAAKNNKMYSAGDSMGKAGRGIA